MRWTVPASLLAVLACGLTELARPAEPRDPAAERQPSASRLANAAEVRKRLGLMPEYKHVAGVELLKVAVLDYGFAGVGGGRPYLPANAVVVEDYDPAFVRRFGLGDPDYRKPLDPRNHHGRTMAQIVWGVTGFDPRGPRFYLLNANGPTMLRRAVRYAIEQKVDIVLFSGVFEGGGNGDGRGPINRIVADALAAGIVWINAAGNCGHHVYEGPVRIDGDGSLRFRAGRDGTALRFRNYLDENTVTITLTWNDYREKEDAGTDKDLDLYVEDWIGKRLGASAKTQVSGDRIAAKGESRNPRERVVLTDLAASQDFNYRIRVRARKNNFTARDRLRVLVAARQETYVDPATSAPREAVKFFDATGRGELYPPADNPGVLTVGDASPASAVGPTADGRVKPDVVLEDARAFFSDGEVSAGSSDAAAYFAAIVVVLKAAEPGLRGRHLLALARQSSRPSPTPTASAPRDPTPQPSLLRDSRLLPGRSPYPADSRFLPPYPYGLLRPGGTAYRFYPPPSYAATPWGRTVVIGPDPRRTILPFPGSPPFGTIADRSSETSRPSTSVLPPAGRQAAAVSETPSPRGRVWRTPSRAQLAAVVRATR